MTVSNTQTKLTYAGNGTARTFGITFPLLSAAHLRIVVTDEDGTETEVVNNFAVSVHLDSVTYPTLKSGLPPLGIGKKITLLRRTPLTQEIDLQRGHALDAEELERGYDKLTLAMQEAAEEIDRAVKFPVGSSGAQTDASGYLKTIEAAVETAAAQGTAAQTAAASAANSASEAASNLTLCAGYCTNAEAAANSAALAADNASQYKTAAADSASMAAASSTEAENAKNSAEAAAETASQKLTAHNTDGTAHADIRAQLAGKQPVLPNGTAGQILTKTADGVAWTNAASGGGNMTVDDALSSASENPVQNKVITAALDEKQNALTPGANITIENNVISATGGGGDNSLIVDSALSDTSENPVQNKVVTAALAEKLAQYLLLAGGTLTGALNIIASGSAKIHLASEEYKGTSGGDYYFEVPGQTLWLYTTDRNGNKLYLFKGRYDGGIVLNTEAFLGSEAEENRILRKKMIGSADGIASLDSNTKVPVAQLPDLSNKYVPIHLGTEQTLDVSGSRSPYNYYGPDVFYNGILKNVGKLHLAYNRIYRGNKRGFSVSCNYDDVEPLLSEHLLDGDTSGYYISINPSEMFTDKPFVFEITRKDIIESSDVTRLRMYGHRLGDVVNATHYKIEVKYGPTDSDWGIAYEHEGNSENICAQYALKASDWSNESVSYYPIYGLRLTIYSSPDTIFRLSEIEIISERGNEQLVNAIHAIPDSGGDVYGDIVMRSGNYLRLQAADEKHWCNLFIGNDNLVYFSNSGGIWLYPDTKGPKGKPIYEQDKGASDGVAPLNENGKVPEEYLPDMSSGGSGRAVGEVFFSQSKEAADNPGALPLFTGETIASADTLYPEFYAWLQKHPELQCTAAEYEAALSEFGECPFYALTTEDIYGPGVNIATRENAISSGEADFLSGYLDYPFDGEAAGPNGTNYWNARGQGDTGDTFVGCYLGNIGLTQKVTTIKMAQGIWASSSVSSVTVQYSPDNGTTWQDLQTYDTPLQANYGDYNVLELPEYTPAATYGLRVMAATEPENIRSWWVYELQFLTAGAKTGEEKKVRLPLLKNYVKMAEPEEGIAQKKAGLPNITGETGGARGGTDISVKTGAFAKTGQPSSVIVNSLNASSAAGLAFDASLSSSVYGASDTVTPAHTTLYPWVFAYNAAVAASTAQAAEFQNALSGKVDLPAGKTQADVDVVVDSYSDDAGNWYRQYKSGWIEQGGQTTNSAETVSLLKPMAGTAYFISVTPYRGTAPAQTEGNASCAAVSATQVFIASGVADAGARWEVKGEGE